MDLVRLAHVREIRRLGTWTGTAQHKGAWFIYRGPWRLRDEKLCVDLGRWELVSSGFAMYRMWDFAMKYADIVRYNNVIMCRRGLYRRYSRAGVEAIARISFRGL